MTSKEPDDQEVCRWASLRSLLQSLSYLHENFHRLRLSWIVIEPIDIIFVRYLILFQALLQIETILFRGQEIRKHLFILTRLVFLHNIAEMRHSEVDSQGAVLDKWSLVELLVDAERFDH